MTGPLGVVIAIRAPKTGKAAIKVTKAAENFIACKNPWGNERC